MADTSSREKPLCSELATSPLSSDEASLLLCRIQSDGLQSMEVAVSHTRSSALSNLQYMPKAEQWLQESGCGQDHTMCIQTYSMTEGGPKLSSPELWPLQKTLPVQLPLNSRGSNIDSSP